MQGGKFRGRRGPSQCASAILMVRPKHFGFNAQTAGTNRFQQAGTQVAVHPTKSRSGRCASSTLSPRRWPRRASAVCVVRGLRHPAQTRRRVPEQLGELPRRRHRGAVSDARREPPRGAAHARSSTRWCATPDSRSPHPRSDRATRSDGRFLEGTGSLVLDHVDARRLRLPSRRAPTRTWRGEWAREMGYELELFTATDRAGTPIYHTNVAHARRHTHRGGGARLHRAARPRAASASALAAAGREVLADRSTPRCARSPATCWRWAAGTSTSATSASW